MKNRKEAVRKEKSMKSIPQGHLVTLVAFFFPIDPSTVILIQTQHSLDE